jgi:hypothetical protein
MRELFERIFAAAEEKFKVINRCLLIKGTTEAT